MALVTVARYRVVTGDSTSASAAVEDALADAVQDLEADLGGRPLEQKSRTEVMRPDRAGRLWPLATPLVSVDPASSLMVDGASLIGVSPFPFGADFISGTSTLTVTYVGGFLERTAHEGDLSALPAAVERDLCFAAYQGLHPELAVGQLATPGATSRRVGDAAVGYGAGGAPAPGARQWSRSTMRLSRIGRRVPRAVGSGPAGAW